MPEEHLLRARRHIENARELIHHAAETTRLQDIDDQLDSIDEALRTIDRWEDEPKKRLDQIRRELYEMETETALEDELHREVRFARGHIRSYQTDRFGTAESIDS